MTTMPSSSRVPSHRYSSMRFLITFAMAVWMTLQESATAQQSLVYRFTARDFMPCACMANNEIDLFWKNTDKQGSNPKLINNSAFCPIRNDIIDGFYSGHPDFEAHPDLYANGCSGEEQTMLSDPTLPRLTLRPGGKSCNLDKPPFSAVTRIVLNTMERSSAGIPKPIYCSRGNGPHNTFYPNDKRCGWEVGKIPVANALVSTTGEEMFNLWFNDNPKYSKRVGVTRVMKPIPNQEGVFYYDSDEEGGFHPIDDHRACRAVNNRLDCTNGGKVFPKSLLEGETHFDPYKSPVNEAAINKSFSFTIEMHSFFTFRGTETFNFTGDDDVWVFINERLAVDVGGLHVPTDGVVNLNDTEVQTYLGLEVGGTYAIDIFMAERHSIESNFLISTSLSPGCNIESSGKVAYAWNESTIAQDWKLVGGPNWGHVLGDRILVLNRNVPNVASYAFLRQQFNVGTGFIVTFKFQTSKNDGEGFTLVVQRDRLVDLNGGSGGHLGFLNMKNALGVAFDFCVDRSSAPSPCKFKQVRLHHTSSSQELSSAINTTAKLHERLYHPNEWNDGQVHTVQIKYYYKTPDWLEVIVDEDVFLQQRGINLEELIGGRNAWIGVTAGSGPFSNFDLSVFDFEVRTVSLEDSNTGLLDNLPPSTARANGRDVVNFTVQTRDFCLETIEFGGFERRAGGFLYPDNLTASSEPIPAEIVDESNGRYRFEFKSIIPGTYSVELWFGEECDADPFNQSKCFRFTRNASATFLPFVAPTAAPIALGEPDSVPVRIVMGAGITAGILALFSAVAIFFAMRVRRRWLREKPFIEAGRLAAMEREIEYQGDAQIDEMQRRLHNVLMAIQHERAHQQKNVPNKAMEKLLRDKGELEEIVRRLRQKARERNDVLLLGSPTVGGQFATRIRSMAANVRESINFRRMGDSRSQHSGRMSSISNRASRMLEAINPIFGGFGSVFSKAGKGSSTNHSQQSDFETAETLPASARTIPPPVPPRPSNLYATSPSGSRPSHLTAPPELPDY